MIEPTFSIGSLFGATHIIPVYIWIASIVLVFLISVIAHLSYNHFGNHNRLSYAHAWGSFIIQVAKNPFIFLLYSYIAYAAIQITQIYVPQSKVYFAVLPTTFLLSVIEFSIFFWLMFNALSIGKKRLLNWSITTGNRTINVLVPAIASSLQAAVFLLMINLLIPTLHLEGFAGVFLNKFAKVLLIGVVGWIFVQIVNALEKFILNQYILTDVNNITSRKINTQVLILKKVILTVAIVITLAAILMVFDSVKSVGTGLLTTAGLVSAVGAFASQQSLSRIFAGLQIAFTQPIRIGDTVIIDNEFGQVEEITLSYIVVKVWDLRRLILPTDYFTSKGLQNLTRSSSQLLGTIFLYTDYTLPVEIVRRKFHELLSASPLWDKKVANFQVTDIKESTMEIRALMSAQDSGTLWNLRCEIREQLIKFIVEHYPECLSKSRQLNLPLKHAANES